MTTPTPEAMSPAQEAWFDYRKDYGSWHEPELSQAHKHFVAGFEFAQSEGLPLIAAQAKAEALIAFADAHRMPEPMFMDDGRTVTVGDLLREQAAEYRATIEGEKS